MALTTFSSDLTAATCVVEQLSPAHILSERLSPSGKFAFDVKRFYVPFCVKSACPKCGIVCERNLARYDYLSYPPLGEGFEYVFYCGSGSGGCENEWSVPLRLDLSLRVEGRQGQEGEPFEPDAEEWVRRRGVARDLLTMIVADEEAMLVGMTKGLVDARDDEARLLWAVQFAHLRELAKPLAWLRHGPRAITDLSPGLSLPRLLELERERLLHVAMRGPSFPYESRGEVLWTGELQVLARIVDILQNAVGT